MMTEEKNEMGIPCCSNAGGCAAPETSSTESNVVPLRENAVTKDLTPSSQEETSLIVASKVRQFVKEEGCRCSDGFIEAFKQFVRNELKNTTARCKANGRATLKEYDTI
jgi:hypothetical protein